MHALTLIYERTAHAFLTYTLVNAPRRRPVSIGLQTNTHWPTTTVNRSSSRFVNPRTSVFLARPFRFHFNAFRATESGIFKLFESWWNSGEAAVRVQPTECMGDVLYRSTPSASGTGSLLSGRMMILFRKKKFVLEIFLDQLRVVNFYDTRGVNRGGCSATFSHVFLFCKRSNGYW